MSKLSINKGRPRLRVLLGALSGGACLVAMALLLVFYGTPYDPVWWAVMAAALAAACLLPSLFIPAIEWVIEGYSADD